MTHPNPTPSQFPHIFGPEIAGLRIFQSTFEALESTKDEPHGLKNDIADSSVSGASTTRAITTSTHWLRNEWPAPPRFPRQTATTAPASFLIRPACAEVPFHTFATPPGSFSTSDPTPNFQSIVRVVRIRQGERPIHTSGSSAPYFRQLAIDSRDALPERRLRRGRQCGSSPFDNRSIQG